MWPARHWRRLVWWPMRAVVVTVTAAAMLAAMLAGQCLASAVRVHEHPGFSRVVFGVPPRVKESVTQQGGRLLVALPGAGLVAATTQSALHVGRIEGGNDQAVLDLEPGSTFRVWHRAGLVVVDVYPPGSKAPGALAPIAGNPTAAKPVAAVRLPAGGGGQTSQAGRVGPVAMGLTLVPVDQRPLPPPGPAIQAQPPALPPQSVVKAEVAPGALASAGASGAVAGAGAGTGTGTGTGTGAGGDPVAGDALIAVRLPDDAVSGEACILLPFGRLVGAAAFPRGGLGHVVFGDSKPLDLQALKDDPVFGSARVLLLPSATHLTLKLAAGARMRLRHQADGWVVAVGQATAADASAKLTLQKGLLSVANPAASDSLVMDDPTTGGRLLVGLVSGEGPGVAAPHLSPEFALLPSWAGVLVAVNSDRLVLRAAKGAFTLGIGGAQALAAQLAEVADSSEEAAALTRHFDFPALPTGVLLNRMRAALRAAATAPRLGRLGPRLQAAQAMLALGLDREAGGLLRAAMQDDPGQAASPDGTVLLAMADWLAGVDGGPDAGLEPGQTTGAALSDPALGKSDEITLWQAVMQMPGGDQKAAAAALSATWRLLLVYPDPLRRRLLRPAAEALVQGGQLAAADSLLARFADPRLNDVRAALLAQRNHGKEALALLDKVAASTDRKQAAAAARQAVELRLTDHEITPSQAAAELEKRLYSWRDDATELAARLRVAELRTQAAKWRQALGLLRDTEALFPDARGRLRTAELAVIADLLRDGQAQRLPALDLVALVQESADLLSAKEASATLAPVLVDKLLALDLPGRAEPILAQLMVATDALEPKAALGARLAALRLDDGHAAGALSALADSDSPGLSASLQSGRAVLRARALAASGQEDAALALLGTLGGSVDALALQADLLERRQDWHGTESALLALMQASLPKAGALSVPQQNLVLRAASAAAQAGDIAVLQQLQAGDGRRLDPGPRTALFQALTQAPIQSLTDLPRSGREAEAARAVPAALASFNAH